VHISELANFRVKQTEDIVKIGDEIWSSASASTTKAGLNCRARRHGRTRQTDGGEELSTLCCVAGNQVCIRLASRQSAVGRAILLLRGTTDERWHG